MTTYRVSKLRKRRSCCAFSSTSTATKVVLLLGGYDKGKDSKDKRQQREIAQARMLLAQFKARQSWNR